MAASNIYPSSNNLNGSTVVEFGIPVKYLAITNTSGSSPLEWKFTENQDYSTLVPTEIITMEDVSVYSVILKASDGSYRVMGRG